MNGYRQRIFDQTQSLLEPYLPLTEALDFGCGDGWFAHTIRDRCLAGQVTAVDVQRRPGSLVEPLIYEGQKLPFADRSFELTYAIDVLHHCHQPREQLRELARCSRRFLLIKDHTCQSWGGRVVMATVDKLSNWRFGVACPLTHQRGWEWLPWFEDAGFVLDRLIHPATCHVRIWDRFLDRFEFMALWRREE